MESNLHPQWQGLDFAQLIAAGAAFISMDAQNSILNAEGCLTHEGIWRGAREPGGSLHNALRVADSALSHGMPRIWFRYDRFIGETRPSSELDRVQYQHWNKDYPGDKERKRWECELVPEVIQRLDKNDLNLVYPGWSIFTGTSLERWLNQWGVRTLLLCGYHTDWCVEMAARHARELGYSPIVIADASGSTRPLHEDALRRIDSSFAPVLGTDQVLAAIGAAHIRAGPETQERP